jgi:type VI protein secretion system component Hcp
MLKLRSLKSLFHLGIIGALVTGDLFSAGFIKLEGIRGDATDGKHDGWTEIVSVSTAELTQDLSEDKSTSKATPTRPDGTLTRAFTFTKVIDKTSLLITRRVAVKERMKTVKVDFQLPDGNQMYMVLWEVTYGATRDISETEEEVTLYYETAQSYDADKIRNTKSNTVFLFRS